MAQKTLISLVTSVCAELNLPAPTEVIASQDNTVQKIRYLLTAVCDDLLREHDWQSIQRRYTFTTSEGETDYDFPGDMDRFISGTFFDETSRWPMRGPATPMEWEYLQTTSISSTPFIQFRILADKITLFPTPGSSAATVLLDYISSYYVLANGTLTPQAEFTDDSDICAFDHRLVIYGTKLKFLASISQDTTSALADYQRALEFAKGADIPGRRLFLGTQPAVPLLSNANYPDGTWGGV